MYVTRYYITGTRADCSETFWSGKTFTRFIDECKVYISMPAAQKQLVKLINAGYSGIELKETKYTI